MKFTCPKCQTRYTIPDDKVPAGKTLRFTCRKCSNLVRLQRRRKQQTQSNTAAAAQQAKPGAATAQQAAGAQAPTRSAGSARSAEAAAASPFDESTGTGSEAYFVLIKGQQQGPLPLEQIKKLLEGGAITPRNYIWRQGMAEWARIENVAAFRQSIAAAAHRAAAPAPAPRGDHGVVPSENVGASDPKGIDAGGAAAEAAAAALGASSPGNAATSTKAEANAAVQKKVGSRTDPDLGANQSQEVLQAVASLTELATPGSDDAGAPAAAPHPSESPQGPPGDDYLSAPPGEATRVFMATAGIFQRRRKQKAAAIAGGIVTLILASLITADLTGAIKIPGMGFVYDVTGMEDPNVDRAIERIESKVASSDLTPEERKALQNRLLGLTKNNSKKKKKPARRAAAASSRKIATQGIEEKNTLTQKQRDLAASIFSDDRKSDTKLKDLKASDIQTPNLPDGLTQESIFKVIDENKRSMSLCIAESLRKGEKLSGRMEVELTIAATGSVEDAIIGSSRFKDSTIGKCTTKRARGWRFPRFNGEPVTVIFPYVLSSGI